MWISSQSQLSEWQALLGEDLGVVSFPTASPTAHSNTVRADCAVVSAGAAQAEAAWLWVHFLSAQAPVALGSQQAAPARKSVAESSGYWRNMDGGAAGAIRYALEHGWYGRDAMPEIAAAGEALLETLSGQGTLAENLPLTVDAQQAGPAALDDASIVVATPVAAASAATVDYYAPPPV